MKTVFAAIADFIRETDKILLSLIILCSGFGIVAIASATNYSAALSNKYIVQTAGVLLGIVAAIVVSLIDYKTLSQFWPIYAVISVGLVLLTFFIGVKPEGSDDRAWLNLFGGITLQPSELLKIAFILTFVKHVSSIPEEEVGSFKNLVLMGIHGLVPIGLIVLQGDDGTVMVFGIMLVLMLFVAGVKLRYFAIMGGVLAVAIPIYWFRFMDTWQKQRFYVIFDDNYDPLGMGWQQHQSKTAIANGGIFGQGLFNGEYTQSGAIPKGYNDCIFAAIGEELGLIGAFLVILLLGGICLRCLLISRKARDKMGTIICIGVFAMFGGQAIINLGMCLGLLPVIGVTLPLFSAGGTSVLTLIMSLGLVLNVYAHRNKRKLTLRGR